MRSETAVRIAAALFLCVHVAVPLRQLVDDDGQRWGWQMFAERLRHVPVTLTYPDRVEHLSLAALLPNRRPEILPSTELHRRICRDRPGLRHLELGAISEPCAR